MARRLGRWPDRYAYGFEESIADGVRFFGHDGGAPGVNGLLRIYPQTGYVIAVLSNRDPPTATRLGVFIGDRLALSQKDAAH